MTYQAQKVIGTVLVLLVLVGGGYYLFKTKIGTINIPNKEPIDTPAGGGNAESLPGFDVPEGFSLRIFAKDVPGARAIEIGPRNEILVSQTGEGKIVALRNKDFDGEADEAITVKSNLNGPHGLAFQCPDDGAECRLYVAEKDALKVFDYDRETSKVSNEKKLLDFPAGSLGTHFTRSLLFLPSPDDEILLISIGSSCNVCHESDTRRASILSYDTSTGKSEQYAKGLRNSVFMTLSPVDGKVFATEMGRDNLGDNVPPDEINIIEKWKNYGWPICYGKNIHDTQFDKNTYIRNPCMEPFETPSLVDLQAHSAPLGLAFIPEEGWPEEYWYDLLVAYHGSWNRSEPTGYKIVRLKMSARGEYSGTEDFIVGWLRSDGAKVGRPVDIKVFSGGVAYISDDSAGVIYKLSRD